MTLLGLLGAGHCVGMCGGIAGALGFAGDERGGLFVFMYNLGRIGSYAIAGAIVATLGYMGSEYLALGPVLRALAGLLLVAMGLYLADWWRGLALLERAGSKLWRKLQPLTTKALPVRSASGAAGLGMVWGWLPCGLVYSALAYAATAPSPYLGAATMLAFGLGTLPAMLVAGWASGRVAALLRARRWRQGFALVILGYGCWLLLQAAGLSRHAGH
ncbi:MAG TPA: cytochrome biogenesis protein [Porticoccaceae bacterium]|nr:cytochrome biogenesis protein [Porticoccaceae bacterium]